MSQQAVSTLQPDYIMSPYLKRKRARWAPSNPHYKNIFPSNQWNLDSYIFFLEEKQSIFILNKKKEGVLLFVQKAVFSRQCMRGDPTPRNRDTEASKAVTGFWEHGPWTQIHHWQLLPPALSSQSSSTPNSCYSWHLLGKINNNQVIPGHY